MKRLTSFLFFVLCAIAVQAQEEKKQFIHKGLIRSQATISPGYLLKDGAITINLHGALEYYIADNISFRGDGYYDMLSGAGADTEGRQLQFNHSLFSGASYHFETKNHFDPYLGFQPGIALAERIDWSVYKWFAPVPNYYYLKPQPQINPLISPVLGFNLYFQKYFHLFMETRYVYGRHISKDGAPAIPLSEFRFSFGLGFNINLLKKK